MKTPHLTLILALFFSLFLVACEKRKTIDFNSVEVSQNGQYQLKANKHLLHQYSAVRADGLVNVVVEIPAGTLQKWEVNKETGGLKWDFKKGKARIVNFVGYPGNYGMIPQTLLPKLEGGDGDPLDVLVLGSPQPRGSVIPVKIIGVLLLKDGGEMDDKLIAVLQGSPLDFANNLDDLNQFNPKILQIVELWFTGYKGAGKIISAGYAERKRAMEILKVSQAGYAENQK